jgi:hypothetical protein
MLLLLVEFSSKLLIHDDLQNWTLSLYYLEKWMFNVFLSKVSARLGWSLIFLVFGFTSSLTHGEDHNSPAILQASSTWTWRSLQDSRRNIVLSMSQRGGEPENKKNQRFNVLFSQFLHHLYWEYRSLLNLFRWIISGVSQLFFLEPELFPLHNFFGNVVSKIYWYVFS